MVEDLGADVTGVVTTVQEELTAAVTQAVADVSVSVSAVAVATAPEAPAAAPAAAPVTAFAVPKTPAAAFMAALLDMVQHKPQSAAEAAALYEYLLHKEIIPLMKQLQGHVASELPKLESEMVTALFSKGTNLQAALMEKVTGCFPGFFKK